MVGSISFSQFPANWKIPLHWVEVDSSRAGLPSQDSSALIMGTRKGGSAASDVPTAIGSAAEGAALFGAGSQIARMISAFLANNAVQTLYAAGVDEPSSGTAATGRIDVTTAPTDAGVLNLYIAGQLVRVSVAASDTASGLAAKIAAAVNALTSLPVTAAQGTDSNNYKVTLTCKWKGATGNDIMIQDSLLGSAGGQSLPGGLVLTYTAMTGGVGTPDLTDVIANMADEDYKFLAHPFVDSGSLGVTDTEYGFSDSGRWGFLRQLYGAVYSAERAAFATLMTNGAARNYATTTIMAFEPATPSPMWEMAAAYAARASRALTNDPARPLQTLEFDGVMSAGRGARFTKTQVNQLASVGYATQMVSANGRPMIVRESTCYQRNIYGVSDDAYELVTTLFTLSSLFERQRHAITSKFPRHKLADDGTRFGAGQAIVTPKIIKAELVAQYAQDEYAGLVENMKAFKENLLVQRDPDNPNRVSVLYPPDLINQLRIFAVLAQFRLSYDRGAAASMTA